MKTLVMLTVLACASTVGLHAQATLLEHFQCYPVLDADPALVPPTLLSLSDQFNPAFEDVKLERPLEFCNPTRKIHRNQAYGVYDTLQHLTFLCDLSPIGTAAHSSAAQPVWIPELPGTRALRARCADRQEWRRALQESRPLPMLCGQRKGTE